MVGFSSGSIINLFMSIDKEKNNTDIIFVVSDNIVKSREYMNNVNTLDFEVKFIEEEPMYVDLLIYT